MLAVGCSHSRLSHGAGTPSGSVGKSDDEKAVNSSNTQCLPKSLPVTLKLKVSLTFWSLVINVFVPCDRFACRVEARVMTMMKMTPIGEATEVAEDPFEFVSASPSQREDALHLLRGRAALQRE